MLDPQDRTVLLEALSPPEGFLLDEGIATTFGLDLISLVTVPLAFTLFEWEDAQGRPTSNPVLLLEALRRHMKRLTIFCQAGRIAVPRPNPLFGYLEECVVEVTAGRPDGVFHPKVWALRFLNQATGEVCYRLLCLSRNLTDDRSWDLSLVLEGPLVDRKVGFSVNRPLADFVKALPSLALRTATDVVRLRADRIAEELRRVDFTGNLPDTFDSLAFHPIGIEGYLGRPLPEAWKRGLIISPFIDRKQAEFLALETEGSVLVSRAEELDRIPAAALQGFASVYVLAEAAEGEEEPEVEDGSGPSDSPKGLHAKLFLCEQGRECHLFVGSANATTAAFERNVEFLIELVGSRARIGVDQFLSPGEGQASLQSLLVPYESPAVPKDDSAERALDDLLNAARSAMVGADWKFKAVASASGGWTLHLVRPEGADLALPAAVAIKVWPVTLPEQTGTRTIEASTRSVDFTGLSLASLTSFLACEARATTAGASGATRFVLNLPILGSPTGRREAILRNILDDPGKVLRFLQFLLGEGDPDQLAEIGSASADAASSSNAGQEGFVLLESLLRALARNPARLDEVASVLKELGDDAEAKRRLPAGLSDVWPAIWAAREGLVR